MAARIIVDLSGGKIVLFGGAQQPGASATALSDSLTRASVEEFAAALGSIGELVNGLHASIDALPRRPEKVEIEFGATLSQECDLWIVAADASPEFKIKLAWGKGD